ncbi:hypothetical protein PSPO01_10088 [Paraphaeosphaeria sporulosa]
MEGERSRPCDSTCTSAYGALSCDTVSIFRKWLEVRTDLLGSFVRLAKSAAQNSQAEAMLQSNLLSDRCPHSGGGQWLHSRFVASTIPRHVQQQLKVGNYGDLHAMQDAICNGQTLSSLWRGLRERA